MTSSSDESSSYESDSDNKIRSSSKWTINLQSYSTTKTKLETELRNKTSTVKLLNTYCSGQTQFDTVNPFLSPDGANPFLTMIYKHHKSNDPQEAIILCKWGKCQLTDKGTGLKEVIVGSDEENKVVKYGDNDGGVLATPDQIHFYPSAAWRSYEAFYALYEVQSIDEDNHRRLKRRMKRWLRTNHYIWSTIVDRLPQENMYVTSGLEMSQGVQLLCLLSHRFGHSHAQCLAEMLRILTNLTLTTNSSNKREKINDYFARGRRIARDSADFEAMTTHIAEPLVKVFLLEGLRRSDSAKYKNAVMQAYANNLKDSFDQLRTVMQTVEGTRTEDIRKEYAPALAAEASVQMGAPAPNKKSWRRKPRADDDEPCRIEDHVGHTNKQCRLQRNKGFTYNGKKGLCWHFTKHGHCRYGSKCRFKHSRSSARAHMAEHGSSSESPSESDDSSSRHKHRRQKHKKNKRKHKKKKKKRSRRAHQNNARASRKSSAYEDYMTNNESESSCDESESDF